MSPEPVVGRNIRRIRLARSISQEALAFEVGIAARHLGRIERGAISATIGVIARIAEALECAIADMFEDTDAPMPPNLPRGRHGSEAAPDILYAREEGTEYRPGPHEQASDSQVPGLGALRDILETGVAGTYGAAAERMIAEIVAEAGGEKKLSAAQRRRIELARIWAITKDIQVKDEP